MDLDKKAIEAAKEYNKKVENELKQVYNIIKGKDNEGI